MTITIVTYHYLLLHYLLLHYLLLHYLLLHYLLLHYLLLHYLLLHYLLLHFLVTLSESFSCDNVTRHFVVTLSVSVLGDKEAFPTWHLLDERATVKDQEACNIHTFAL